MRYSNLGNTGLLISELCLGTMTFGGNKKYTINDQQTVTALVQKAFDSGINFFDTADMYCNGQSEEMLGEAIRQLGLRRDELVIASKVFNRVADRLPSNADTVQQAEAQRRHRAANISGLSRKHIFTAIDNSLQRLGLDYIDLYQIHGFDPITPLEETLEALNDLVRVGKIRYTGFCNLSAWQAMKAIGVANQKAYAKFVSAQLYYSLVGRDIERELVPLAKDQSLAILPWSPLAGGLLSGKYRHAKDVENSRLTLLGSAGGPPVQKAHLESVLDALESVASTQQCSVASVALAWLLQRPSVTSVIVGARTVEQLFDNLSAATVSLTESDMGLLSDASKLDIEYPQWMIDYQSMDRLRLLEDGPIQ